MAWRGVAGERRSQGRTGMLCWTASVTASASFLASLVDGLDVILQQQYTQTIGHHEGVARIIHDTGYASARAKPRATNATKALLEFWRQHGALDLRHGSVAHGHRTLRC